MKRIFSLFFAFVILLTGSVIAYAFEDQFDSDNWTNKTGTVSVSDSKTTMEESSSAELSLNNFDVSESGTVNLEMKMTVNSYGRSGSLPTFYGTLSDDDNAEAVELQATSISAAKKFALGGESSKATVTAGNTYILKYTFDFINNNVKLAVYDGEGNQLTTLVNGEEKPCETTAKAFLTGSSKIYKLDKISFSTLENLQITLDYIKIDDGSFKIMELNVSENEVVTIDKDIIFKLNGEVNEETLSNISVTCGVENIEYEISENNNGEYVIYFPYGLEYNTNYTIVFPGTITSSGQNLPLYARTVNFKTEMHPYYAKDVMLSATDLQGQSSVQLTGTFINNTSADSTAVVMVFVYNAQNNLVNTYYKPHSATKGETTINEPIDLSQTTGAKTAKIYVWNNLFGMSDVIQQ